MREGLEGWRGTSKGGRDQKGDVFFNETKTKTKTKQNNKKQKTKQKQRDRERRETACKGVMIPSGTGIRDRVTIHTISRPLASTAKYATNSGTIRQSGSKAQPPN